MNSEPPSIKLISYQVSFIYCLRILFLQSHTHTWQTDGDTVFFAWGKSDWTEDSRLLDAWGTRQSVDLGIGILIELYSRFIVEYSLWKGILAGNGGSK